LKAAVLLLLAAVAVIPAQPPPFHDGRGALAVLRRDGILFPFATFNRDSWRVAWPVNFLEVPLTLNAIPANWWGTPVPHHWRGHLGNGASVDLELKAPMLFRTQCMKRLGIATTYRSEVPLPPAPVEPFPKDGLAISGNVPFERIESVDPASPEWSALPAALQEWIDRLEETTVSRVRTGSGWRHPLKKEERSKYPIRIESWYRSPSGEPGWDVSYIEAVRVYPPGPEDKGCGLETYINGWIHHENGVLKDAGDLRAKITYCDRVGAKYMLPFGRVRPRDRWYWVFQMSSREDEWYDVVEVGREKIRYVIEVLAGRRFGECR
jgi:hypothetical protein